MVATRCSRQRILADLAVTTPTVWCWEVFQGKDQAECGRLATGTDGSGPDGRYRRARQDPYGGHEEGLPATKNLPGFVSACVEPGNRIRAGG